MQRVSFAHMEDSTPEDHRIQWKMWLLSCVIPLRLRILHRFSRSIVEGTSAFPAPCHQYADTALDSRTQTGSKWIRGHVPVARSAT